MDDVKVLCRYVCDWQSCGSAAVDGPAGGAAPGCLCAACGHRQHLYLEGKPEHAQECLLLIKTRSALYPQIERTLRENHSYSLPEIVQIPFENGLPEYLRWIDENTVMDDQDEKRLHEDHE